MDRKVKMNGVAIAGQTLSHPRVPSLILGDDNGYVRGDILDANAVQMKINEVLGGAPDAFDTLKELADRVQYIDTYTHIHHESDGTTEGPKQTFIADKNSVKLNFQCTNTKTGSTVLHPTDIPVADASHAGIITAETARGAVSFFAPNATGTLDSYDALKVFFDDTPVDFTYTKNSNVQCTNLISDEEQTIIGVLDKEFVQTIQHSDHNIAWLDIDGVEGKILVELGLPYYNNSDEFIIDGVTTRCCMCITENGYANIQFETPVDLRSKRIQLYGVYAYPVLESFETRMDGKVDVLHVWSGTDSSVSFNYNDFQKKFSILNNSTDNNSGISIASANTIIAGENAEIQTRTVTFSSALTVFNMQPTMPALYPIMVNNTWNGACGLGTNNVSYIATGWIARPLMNVLSGRVFYAVANTISTDTYNGTVTIDTGALCLSLPSTGGFEVNSTLTTSGTWVEITLTDFLGYCSHREICFMIIPPTGSYNIVYNAGNEFYINNNRKMITKVEYLSQLYSRNTRLRFTFSDL